MQQIPPSLISQLVRENFHKKLRELREDIGITQAEFADAMGVSRAAIGYYESGARLPDIAFITTVSMKTGCSLDFLLGLSKNKIHEPLTLSEEKRLDDTQTRCLKELLISPTFLMFIAHPKTKAFFESFDVISMLSLFGVDSEASGDIASYKVASMLGPIIREIYYVIMEKNPKNKEEMAKWNEALGRSDSMIDRYRKAYQKEREKMELEKKEDVAIEQIGSQIERYRAKMVVKERRLYDTTL